MSDFDETQFLSDFMNNLVLKKREENTNLKNICDDLRQKEEQLTEFKMELCSKCISMPILPSVKEVIKDLNEKTNATILEIRNKMKIEEERAFEFRKRCEFFKNNFYDQFDEQRKTKFDKSTMLDFHGIQTKVQELFVEEKVLMDKLNQLNDEHHAKMLKIEKEYNQIMDLINALQIIHKELSGIQRGVEVKTNNNNNSDTNAIALKPILKELSEMQCQQHIKATKTTDNKEISTD